jgi:hypothetical protein
MTMLLSFDARSAISGSNLAVNTWHVQTSGGLSNAEVSSIIVPFQAFYNAIAAYRATSTSVLIGSRVLIGDVANWHKPVGRPGDSGYTAGHWDPPETILGGSPLNSTNGSGGTVLPSQLASVVSWRTATAGRMGRGRTYLGNLGAAAMNGSTITGTFVTAATSAATTLISAVSAIVPTSGPIKLCVWSPTSGVTREILTGAMDGTFDTMRSRVK